MDFCWVPYAVIKPVDKRGDWSIIKDRKGAAGKRSAPYLVTEVTAVLWGQGRLLLFSISRDKEADDADNDQTVCKQI